MLELLISKAVATTKKWWKWILGIGIALLVVLLYWKISRQAKRIAALTAQKVSLEESVKNLEVLVKNEQDEQIIAMLTTEIKLLQEQIGRNDAELSVLKKDAEDDKKRAAAATNWKELEAVAKGEKR